MITVMTMKPTKEQFTDRLKLASGLQHHGYYEMAKDIADELYRHNPVHAPLCHTLGQISTSLGLFNDSLEYHRQAVELIRQHGLPANEEKAFPIAAFGLAQAEMRQGNFDIPYVWPYWELGRLNISWSPWPGSTYWTGNNTVQQQAVQTDPGTLLVSSEGGYGDTFMFMRWLPLLKKRFKQIKKVGLIVWPSLADFCDWELMGVDAVHRIGVDSVKFADWRYSTSIMGMPAIFKMKSWDDIPPYEDVVGRPMDWPLWENRRDSGGSLRGGGSLRVGFCWRAEENTSPVRTKSLPLEVAEAIADKLLVLSRLLELNRLSLYSLSPERSDLYTKEAFAQPAGVAYEFDRMGDWSKTADYIRSMDFVITVDTAVAHLSGMLKIPTLVLLPVSSCWRWGIGDRDQGPCPWYGPQLLYYRQSKPHEWDADDIARTALSGLSEMEEPNAETQA